MFHKSIRIFISVFKEDCRFFSFMRRSKSRIIGLDQQLVKDLNDEIEYNGMKQFPRSRKGISFLDHFEGKSIEGIDDKDERFGNAIINARNVSNSDNNLMVLEGVNMIRDAIRLNAKMKALYFTKRDLLKDIPFVGDAAKADTFYVRYRDMVKFSNLKTPPGIIAIFQRPDPEENLTDPHLSRKLPLTLILDNIREPGNLGTILRTAAALNLHKVLLTIGCVDLYNEKVLRATMSALFAVPVFHALSWDTIANSLHPNCVVHCADIETHSPLDATYPYYSQHISDFTVNRSYGLVIGGENGGLSNDARQLSEATRGCSVTIPTAQGVNSLNSAVAAAIIMSQFQTSFLSMNK